MVVNSIRHKSHCFISLNFLNVTTSEVSVTNNAYCHWFDPYLKKNNAISGEKSLRIVYEVVFSHCVTFSTINNLRALTWRLW